MIFKRRIQTLTMVSVLFLVPATASADRVDDYVRTFMSERHIPGAAAAVMKNGKVVKVGVYGLASLEHNVPVTEDTVFEIGSVSKQMTAAAIMLLVEDGKVSLDEKIANYLPDTPESWSGVTVRHLLTHSSGIKSYTSLDGFALLKRLKADEFIKQLSMHPLDFTPGERNSYSNSGFNLLAFIVETRSGKPFIEFMRERIFRPLGMTKTDDRDPEYVIRNRASGYEWRGKRHAGRDWDLTDLMGAGSIVSTIGDMVKWNAALNGDTFLRPSSKAELWKQFTFTNGKPSAYGFGWRISDVRGQRLIGHTGQTAGFTAANFRYPDQALAIVVLTNTGETGNAGVMAGRIAKFYVPSMSLATVKPNSDSDRIRDQMVLKALTARVANTPDAMLMTPQLIEMVSTTRAKQINQRIAASGPVKTLTLVGKDASDGQTIYHYRADTVKKLFLWRVAINASGQISQMTLDEEE